MMEKPGTKWPPKKVMGGGMVRFLIQNGWVVKDDPWNLLKQDYGQGVAQPEPQTNGNGASVPEHATDAAQPPTVFVEKKKRPRIKT